MAEELGYTISDLNREFPTDDACLEYIKELHWPNGVTECLKCGVERKHYRVSGRTAYACDHCGNHIYPLAGTIFSKSTTPLKTWFYVMYLVRSTRGRLSAKQIQRETGVTYKTAWRILRQIRKLLINEGPHVEHPAGEMDEKVLQGDESRTSVGQDVKTPVVGTIKQSNPLHTACLAARIAPEIRKRTLGSIA